MARRGRSRAKPAVVEAAEPEGLVAWVKRYIEALRTKNYSERTLETRQVYLLAFCRWCEERSITRPQEVTKPMLERYQRHLFHFRRSNGRPLTFQTQHKRLVQIRMYFKWLTRQNVLLWNPASELELPKLEHRLPRYVLTEAEAEKVLAQPDVSDPLGLRDRAILEVFYSTGIRRMELVRLFVSDIDRERGTMIVRQGKGKKDRTVPIGERAAAWVEKYMLEARRALVVPPDEGVLFLTQEGRPLDANRLTHDVREYVVRAETGKKGACHLFRHTMATVMLENGADIRFIQEMLGHVELSTTQIYAQVSIRQLKAVHALTHPGAKLVRTQRPPLAKTDAATTAEELFSRLAAEDDEDGTVLPGRASTDGDVAPPARRSRSGQRIA
jgi:integrase/recombinase XerD